MFLLIVQSTKSRLTVESQVDSILSLNVCGKRHFTSVVFLPKTHNPTVIMKKVSGNPTLRDTTKYQASTPQNCQGLTCLYCSLLDTNYLKF